MLRWNHHFDSFWPARANKKWTWIVAKNYVYSILYNSSSTSQKVPRCDVIDWYFHICWFGNIILFLLQTHMFLLRIQMKLKWRSKSVASSSSTYKCKWRSDCYYPMPAPTPTPKANNSTRQCNAWSIVNIRVHTLFLNVVRDDQSYVLTNSTSSLHPFSLFWGGCLWYFWCRPEPQNVCAKIVPWNLLQYNACFLKTHFNNHELPWEPNVGIRPVQCSRNQALGLSVLCGPNCWN